LEAAYTLNKSTVSALLTYMSETPKFTSHGAIQVEKWQKTNGIEEKSDSINSLTWIYSPVSLKTASELTGD
jgi:hypothetical protein